MRDIICENTQFNRTQKIRKHAMEIRDDEELLSCDNKVQLDVCSLIVHD
jgi:hypothetical protein